MTAVATYVITPGWYDVPGKAVVRWWNGTSWTGTRLVNGAPRADAMVSTQSVGSAIALAVTWTVLMWVQFATTSMAADAYPTTAAVTRGLYLFVVVLQWTLVIRTLGVKRLPPPTESSLVPADLRPMPGDADGPDAGWRRMKAPDVLRWWTGTQWAEYVLDKGIPMPTFNAVRQGRNALLTFGVATFVAAAAVAVATYVLVTVPDVDTFQPWLFIVLGSLAFLALAGSGIYARWRLGAMNIPA